MQLHALEDLGRELVRQVLIQEDTEIQALVTANPAALAFVARQVRPERAGTVLVSLEAAEDDGPNAVAEAFRRLLELIEGEKLPLWPAHGKAPVLAMRTSQGWQTGVIEAD